MFNIMNILQSIYPFLLTYPFAWFQPFMNKAAVKIHDKSLGKQVFVYLVQIPRSKIAEPALCPEVWNRQTFLCFFPLTATKNLGHLLYF